MAVGLLVGGRLGDMYGRKRMMIVGVAGFLVASALCAVSVSPEMLLASRVLQGLFGAVMVPQSFGLIRELFGADVGKAFARSGRSSGSPPCSARSSPGCWSTRTCSAPAGG